MSKSPVVLLILLFTVGLTSCSNKPSEDELKAHIKKTIDSLIFVEGGSFMMGDAGGKFIDEHGKEHYLERFTGSKNDEPAHEVILDSYSMHRHEVTYGEYDIYTRSVGKPLLQEEGVGYMSRSESAPVSGINYFDSQSYCQWLGKVIGLPADLPTEAQWEYAARSRGQNVPYATDTGYLEFGRNVVKDIHPYINARQGTYPPNPLGFESMTGNLMEWTKDEFDPKYYHNSPKHNPQGANTGWPGKVVRGGSNASLRKITIHFRIEREPEREGDVIGFRCAINHDKLLKLEELQLNIK